MKEGVYGVFRRPNVRSKRTLLALFAVILAAFLIFHRTPNKSFHPIREVCGNGFFCGSVDQNNGVPLAFVEFDDQGSYFDQRQAFIAFHVIRNAVATSPSGVDVFVFVHGWQHNADSEDSNVTEFREFLEKRAIQDASRKVVGIYIGWPGNTLRIPLNYLTFWSRKAAAHRVASGAVQEFFATLRQVKIDQELAMRDQNSNVPPKIYVIGHSFGGLIVFQANSQSFALRYGGDVIENRGAPWAPGLGDLVILINPAIEASRFASLHALSSEYPNDPFYSPVMISVGSQTDWATQLLFPVGVLFGTLVTNQVRSDQWSDALTTIGNADSYMTHNASMQNGSDVVVCERPHEFSQRKAPFWFVSADPTIIDGHSNIDGDKLLALFSSLKKHVESRKVGGLPSCGR